MFCENCGSVINEEMKFCDKCGAAVKGNKKAPVREKAIIKVLSVFLCVLLVLSETCAGIIWLVRSAASQDAVDDFVDHISIAEIRVNALVHSEKKKELAAYIAENAEGDTAGYMTEENLVKFFKTRFFKDFAKDMLNVYVRDLFKNTGDGVITKDDLEDLLDENQVEICKILGIEDIRTEDEYMSVISTREIWTNVKRSVLDAEYLKDVWEYSDLSEYRNDHPQAFSMIRTLCSYWMAGILLAVSICLAVGLFFLQVKKAKWFCYMGSSMLITGIMIFIPGLLTGVLADKLRKALDLGKEFWQLLLEPVKSSSLRVGGGLMAAGTLMILIYISVRVIQNVIQKRRRRI